MYVYNLLLGMFTPEPKHFLHETKISIFWRGEEAA